MSCLLIFTLFLVLTITTTTIDAAQSDYFYVSSDCDFIVDYSSDLAYPAGVCYTDTYDAESDTYTYAKWKCNDDDGIASFYYYDNSDCSNSGDNYEELQFTIRNPDVYINDTYYVNCGYDTTCGYTKLRIYDCESGSNVASSDSYTEEIWVMATCVNGIQWFCSDDGDNVNALYSFIYDPDNTDNDGGMCETGVSNSEYTDDSCGTLDNERYYFDLKCVSNAFTINNIINLKNIFIMITGVLLFVW